MSLIGERSVAVVGVGTWGGNLARNFARLGALYAVADLHEDRALATAAFYGCRATTFEGAIGGPEIRAVVIATPSDFHFVQARAALIAGKHVFVEKPISYSLEEARVLFALAADRSLVLMTGHVMRFHPAFLKASELLSDGAVGKLQHISSTRFSSALLRNKDSVLWDLAPHDLSMILYLAKGDPSTIVCNYLPGSRDGSSAKIYLGFPDGVVAEIHLSKNHPFKEERLVIKGTRGTMHFEKSSDFPKGRLTLDLNKIGVVVETSDEEPLHLECQEFLRSISQRRQPLANGIEALQVLKVLELAALSAVSDTVRATVTGFGRGDS